MEKRLVFKVQGSEDDPYTVTFTRDGNNVTATCECRASIFGLQCKHRINLLLGDVTAVVTGADHAGKLAGLVAGTDVEAALDNFLSAIAALDQAKKNKMAATKNLAASFND